MGGTLSIAWDSDIRLLDPAQAYDSISQPAERLLFETLVTYDAGTKLVPLLASAMPSEIVRGWPDLHVQAAPARPFVAAGRDHHWRRVTASIRSIACLTRT